MLDGNIIDLLVDGRIALPLHSKAKIVGTLVQRSELERIPDDLRRQQLLNCFDTIIDEVVVTETFVWGASAWGNAKHGSGKIFEEFRIKLKAKDKKPKSQMLNQARDTLIAETSIANGHTLLTTDRTLAEVTSEFGGKAIWYDKKAPSNMVQFD
jgi:hypothetical protein